MCLKLVRRKIRTIQSSHSWRDMSFAVLTSETVLLHEMCRWLAFRSFGTTAEKADVRVSEYQSIRGRSQTSPGKSERKISWTKTIEALEDKTECFEYACLDLNQWRLCCVLNQGRLCQTPRDICISLWSSQWRLCWCVEPVKVVLNWWRLRLISEGYIEMMKVVLNRCDVTRLPPFSQHSSSIIAYQLKALALGCGYVAK